MQDPLITVIIVVLNGEKTLERAILSVTGQSFPSYELVIIDGGSREPTLQIIRKHAAHIGYSVSEPDKGIYDAMNKGVAAARGEWIYFLGCDDYLLDPGIFAAVSKHLLEGNSDLWYGNVLLHGRKYDGSFSMDKLLRRNIAHQAIFYNKSVFTKVGVFSLRYRSHADWEFNIRCFAHAGIRPSYMDLLVAFFSGGGVSAQHDIPMLKQVIIPWRTKALMAGNLESLKSPARYDEWWRLIRNTGIRDADELLQLTELATLPPILHRLVRFQRRIPKRLLFNGFFSKLLMSASYAGSFLRRR